MKLLVNICRICTGALFIFSGLVKAIDPLGLSYKMQEFFEAWSASGFLPGAMQVLNNHTLTISIGMILLEVVAGVALLIGWQKKITALVLFLLISFFTFLTAYVLYSGKVKACGCFGDCIPLSPIQTFVKDIVLLLMSVIILFGLKFIQPAFTKTIRVLVMVLAVSITMFVQLYALKYLPPVDCLPFKPGNNIIELRKMPANAIPDTFEYVFVYEKNGIKKEFGVNNLPDSTWTFVERKQTLVRAGSNNVPLINDFSLTDEQGNDVTEKILGNKESYYLLFVKELTGNEDDWVEDIKKILAASPNKPMYLVTSQREALMPVLARYDININAVFTTDGTAIKTAARANPTLMLMEGAVIKNKLSAASFHTMY